MSKRIITVPVDLPVEIYDDLERQAGRGRRRVGALISKRVQSDRRIEKALKSASKGPPQISARLEKVLGIFKGGDPRAGDNDRIDADLVREAEMGLRRSRR
ncbi:MAG: hypothetical protein FD180_1870 [Planctomycetota bacterium]|nr:MAG: hypothetical protein FD180_1870 [Planctomycetota bacterium]